MNKKNLIIVLIILISSSLFAREKLDTAIYNAAIDITKNCKENSILVVDDFSSPSQKLTLYIREQIADFIFGNSSKIKIVTREHMGIIEKEFSFQNSGVVSTDTLISVAERLGAQSIIFGSFEEENGGYILRVRMLDVETGAYLFRKTYSFSYSQKTEQLLGRAPKYKKVSSGIFGEINKNSIDFLSPSAGLSFDYLLTRNFSLGTKIILSYDFLENKNPISSTEVLGTGRFYIVSLTGEPGTGVFIEGQAGMDFVLVNSDLVTAFDCGICSGYRFAFKNIYFEPSIRFGYPYIFGAEISVGLRF